MWYLLLRLEFSGKSRGAATGVGKLETVGELERAKLKAKGLSLGVHLSPGS